MWINEGMDSEGVSGALHHGAGFAGDAGLEPWCRGSVVVAMKMDDTCRTTEANDDPGMAPSAGHRWI
jgi:hypothetical protein